ncbi:MAG: hypothetical protein M3Y77_10160 [Actinomycetota bacterium]|nr:hypothetical protein [Actinomycetota bacterium]
MDTRQRCVARAIAQQSDAGGGVGDRESRARLASGRVFHPDQGPIAGLTTHYLSASSLLPWYPPTNGDHMAKADCRDIVMVAGRDPYGYKGTADLAKPRVRPDRAGSCDR